MLWVEVCKLQAQDLMGFCIQGFGVQGLNL